MSEWFIQGESRMTLYAKKEGLVGDNDSKKVEYRWIKGDNETDTWMVSVYDTRKETYGEPYAFCMKTEDLSLLSVTRVRLTQEKLKEVFQELKLGDPNEMTRSPIKHGGRDGVEYEVFVKDKTYTVHLTKCIEYEGIYRLLKVLDDKKLVKLLQSLPMERRYEYTGPRVLDIYQVQDRINVVKQIALVYKTLWKVDLKLGKEIGSINIHGWLVPESFSIDKIRKKDIYELGRFSSNSAYLKAWIRRCIHVMQDTAKHEEKRELTRYELAISKMVDFDFKIPSEVEEVPVVFSHEAMYISRMRFTPNEPHVLQDLNLPSSARPQLLPFAESVLDIEQLFWLDVDGSQKIHRDYQKLHDAFWNKIPGWRKCLKSRATQTYLKWARIGHVIKDGPDHEDALDFLRKHT